MTREALDVKIRRTVDEEADTILGELSRLMSPALRTRAEQVAALAQLLKFPVPAPIAWMLDLRDVETSDPAPREYPPGSEGLILRLMDEEHLTRTEARARLVMFLQAEGEPILRGRVAREAELKAAGAGEPVVEAPPARASSGEETEEESQLADAVEAGRAAVERGKAMVEGVDVPVVRTTKPPPSSVSVRPSTVGRTGPPARPPLKVEHVTVKAKGAAKPAVAPKPAVKEPARIKPKRGAGNPGIDAVPEHLRGMPTAKGRGPLGPRIAAAKGELKVYEFVRENPKAVGPEILEGTGLSKSQTGSYTRNLIEAGLVKHTGKERLAKGQVRGRTGKEVVVVEGALPPTQAPRPDVDRGGTVAGSVSTASRPTRESGDTASTRGASPSRSETSVSGSSGSPSSTASGRGQTASEAERELNEGAARTGTDLTGAALLAALRDFAVSMDDKGAFGVSQAADAVGIPVASAEFGLQLLAEQSRGAIVIDVGMPGLARYEYNKIKGPGAAAQRDHNTAKARGAGNGEGAAPVAGTGRKWLEQFSGVPEVQRLVRMAESKWPGSVTKRGSQHIMIKPPGRQPITIGANSRGNGLRKDQKNLESAGLLGAIG